MGSNCLLYYMCFFLYFIGSGGQLSDDTMFLTDEYMVALMYESSSTLFVEWNERFNGQSYLEKDQYVIDHFMNGWFMEHSAFEVARRIKRRLSKDDKKMFFKLHQDMLEGDSQNVVVTYMLVQMVLVLESFSGERERQVLSMITKVGGRDFREIVRKYKSFGFVVGDLPSLQRGEFTGMGMINLHEVKCIMRKLIRRKGGERDEPVGFVFLSASQSASQSFQ